MSSSRDGGVGRWKWKTCKMLVVSVTMCQQLAPHPVPITQIDGRGENQPLLSTYTCYMHCTSRNI